MSFAKAVMLGDTRFAEEILPSLTIVLWRSPECRLWEMKPWGEFFARFKAPRAWKLDALDEVGQHV